MISKPFSTNIDVQGKVAAITGAGSGIGLAISKLFADRGAKVWMMDRNETAAQQEAALIPGADACFVDVADTSSSKAAVDQIIAKSGKIDVLVNCAGIGTIQWAKEFTEKDWKSVLDVNLSGTFFMSQYVGNQMIEAGNGGKIICLASQAGIVAIDKHVAYSASKAGIISMVKSLGYEWGQ